MKKMVFGFLVILGFASAPLRPETRAADITQLHTATRILMDGSFPDWQSVPALYNDAEGDQVRGEIDFRQLKITNDERYLFLSLDVTKETSLQSRNSISLLLDTDCDPLTGISLNGIGADVIWNFGNREGIVVINGQRYFITHDEIGFIAAPTVTSSMFEIAFDRTKFSHGSPLFPRPDLKLVIKDNSGGDLIPESGESLGFQIDATDPPTLTEITLTKDPGVDFRIMTYNVLTDNFFEDSLFETFDRILSAITPDVIGFEEIYTASGAMTAARVESMLPSPVGERWYYGESANDIVMVSRFPIVQTVQLERAGAFLLDLHPRRDSYILVIVAHLSCCSADIDRQRQVDKIMAFIRNLKTGSSAITVPHGTPIVIMGDFNFVGSAQQLETLLTGHIYNQLYGPSFIPDWDESNFSDLTPRHTESPLFYTWHTDSESYSPGRLDFIIYSDSVLISPKQFVVYTDGMSPEALNRYGLHLDDTANAADHLPIVGDFSLPAPTPTVTPCRVSVELQLSRVIFHPGDEFELTAILTNPGPVTYQSQPFVVLLDYYSSYFWYPLWTEQFQYLALDLGIGSYQHRILNFTWPATEGTASGVFFYGAFLTADLTEILGSCGWTSFGW